MQILLNRLLFIGSNALIAAIILIPLFLILNRLYFHNLKRAAAYLIFALYLSAVWSVVGLPDVTYIRLEANINLIPILPMFSDIVNSVLNVALFVPLGFFLPLFWEDYQPARKTVLFGFAASSAIEILQMLTFRATDINDLITNTAGTLIGWCAGHWLLRKWKTHTSQNSTVDLATIFVSVFVVMFFVYPFLSMLF